MTVAMGVNTDGRREGPGMALGASAAEPFRTAFLRDPVRRGLSGVMLAISDAAMARVLSTNPAAQFQRNALDRAGKSRRRVAAALPRSRPGGGPDATHAAEAGHAHGHGGRGRVGLQDFSARHRAKLHATNPIERLNGQIRRRMDAVGIFPDEVSIRGVVGAILMEQTEEWTVQRGRTVLLETLANSARLSSSACLLRET